MRKKRKAINVGRYIITSSALKEFTKQVVANEYSDIHFKKARENFMRPAYQITNVPKEPLNKQGDPIWGYCPSCNKAIDKSGSPVGCKWCLQRIKWESKE